MKHADTQHKVEPSLEAQPRSKAACASTLWVSKQSGIAVVCCAKILELSATYVQHITGILYMLIIAYSTQQLTYGC
jgi:hypothetical protein